jgi:hypothetical protein
MIILKLIFKKGMDCVYWIDLAGDKGRYWVVVVNVVINCRIAYSAGNFLTS